MKVIEKENYKLIYNEDGPTLGVAKDSDVPILEVDGLYFKNLSRSHQLEKYEDWRLVVKERAEDLAKRLSIKQIAGLMLYSSHQLIPAQGMARFGGTYNGLSFDEANVEPWSLSDQQKEFIEKDDVRHILVMRYQNKEVMSKWNNIVQAFAESQPLGIPVNNSSDPRHGTISDAEFNGGANSDISKWPDGIGMAATFDPELVKKYGNVVSKEYRSLGLTTALFPQIDLATEPRWMRFNGTFSESPELATDMARAYCDGLQTSFGEAEIKDGWGYDSINAMVKHFPGGATGEAGRDAHYSNGKYAVHPGKNLEMHLKPFVEGAFKLEGKTKMASAVMPYYTISADLKGKDHEMVGNSYSKYIIQGLLRDQLNYDGVVCTDWGITKNQGETVYSFGGTCWGVEGLTEAERHLKIILAGADQFGGNNDAQPILDAYEMGCKEFGEDYMRKRFELSARRLLMNIFRLGLFENPYVDIQEAKETVGKEEFMAVGYEAQLSSITLLKNKNHVLPLKAKTKVYIPNRHIESYRTFFSTMSEPEDIVPVKQDLVNKYFEWVDTPEKADAAIIFMETPICDSYDPRDVENGGNGYLPISLQYRPYTAVNARKESLAGGDPLESFTNRSYYNKTNTTANETDLDNVLNMKKIMKDKPVIVCMKLKRPTIMSEFEPYADAIIAEYGVQNQAIFDILSGKRMPSGLLPLQIPMDMDTVETQLEDVPFDMIPYVDSEGHCYDFAFGMDFDGVIQDERVKKYRYK